jgi:hypothetical protein
MCQLLGFARAKGFISLDCSPCESAFREANRLRIRDASGKTLVVKDFVVEEQRNCFSDTPPTPWIVLTKDIPEVFLKTGNELELYTEAV